jgi:hypothetical protein
MKSQKPTISELEVLLAAESDEPVQINPDGSIGPPEDYWAKAFRLADELRRHLETRPADEAR